MLHRRNGADGHYALRVRDLDAEIFEPLRRVRVLGPADIDRVLVPAGDIDPAILILHLDFSAGIERVAIVKILLDPIPGAVQDFIAGDEKKRTYAKS